MTLSKWDIQKHVWVFFLLLLLITLFPMGCSRKASKTHMEVGNNPNTLGGRIEVTQDDRSDLTGKAPDAGVRSDDKGSGSSVAICDKPLLVNMGGQEINFSDYIRNQPVIGWLQEEEQQAQDIVIGVDSCQYLRLASVHRCNEGSVVSQSGTANDLNLIVELGTSQPPLFFEARGSLVLQQLPVQAQFILDTSVAYQTGVGNGGESQQLSFVHLSIGNPPLPEFDAYGAFIDVKQRVIDLPSNSFGIRLSELSSGKALAFDIDAKFSVSTPKIGIESATEHHGFLVVRSNYTFCDPFNAPNNALPGEGSGPGEENPPDVEIEI
jgi:hypothetical protein